jgi:type IV pilus assembly protein PilC
VAHDQADRKFKPGRMGWDQFTLKLPVFGQIIEKNIMARTTRTLGTLVASAACRFSKR